MLHLVGFGVSDLRGLTLEGLEVIKKADQVYIETYTSPVKLNLKEVEKFLGKRVKALPRDEVENGKKILEESRSKNVVLLTPGDPLIATTHISLIIDAKKLGINVKVIHAASIYTVAIGESGLQIYKFGKIATLTLLGGNYPYSVYKTIAENKARGLHTLLLLQQNSELKEHPTIKDFLKYLIEMEEHFKEKVLSEEELVIVLSGIGFRDEVKVAGKISKLIETIDIPPNNPAVIIVPGKLHFMEREALKLLLANWNG